MVRRLHRIGGDPASIEGGQALLLVGTLLFALRIDDERVGRTAALAFRRGGDVRKGSRTLADECGLSDLARDRLHVVACLAGGRGCRMWPGLGWTLPSAPDAETAIP